jgi:RimJ/RimL family protein N-acetyltransferase
MLWQLLKDHPDALFHHLFFGPFKTMPELTDWISAAQNRPNAIPIAIYSNRASQFVGTCSLMNIDLEDGSAEIGSIWCAGQFQGSEVISATTLALLSLLFDTHRYRRAVWKCDTTNASSLHAAERMGFVYEGTFRNHMFIRGRSRDTAWYSVIDTEWPETKSHLLARVATKRDEFDRET